MSYLLDTNVISELRKGERAEPSVSNWFDGLADQEIYLSVLTIGEIRRGVESVRRRDPDSAAVLDSWLSRHLPPAGPLPLRVTVQSPDSRSRAREEQRGG